MGRAPFHRERDGQMFINYQGNACDGHEEKLAAIFSLCSLWKGIFRLESDHVNTHNAPSQCIQTDTCARKRISKNKTSGNFVDELLLRMPWMSQMSEHWSRDVGCVSENRSDLRFTQVAKSKYASQNLRIGVALGVIKVGI